MTALESGHQSAFSFCPNEIILWTASPQAYGEAFTQARLREWLSPQERNTLNALRFERHRQTYLVAHALLRGALSLGSDIHPSEWQFRTNPFNKPFIDAPQDARNLHFNLSHTDEMVVIAVTQLGPLGVDVEAISREQDVLALAPEVLSQHEHRDLMQHSEQDQRARLMRYWTLKEAFVKATGLGLTHGVQSFEFDLAAHPHPKIKFLTQSDTRPADWQFRQFTLPSGHIVALAHHQPDSRDLSVTLKHANWL